VVPLLPLLLPFFLSFFTSQPHRCSLKPHDCTLVLVPALVLLFTFAFTGMPRRTGRVAGKTLPGSSGRSTTAGSNAPAAADPSSTHGPFSGDAPVAGRSVTPEASDDSSGSPRTQGQERAPRGPCSAPRPAPVEADVITTAGSNPVGAPKRLNNLLLPSYTMSARPPSRACTDPCLAYVKRLDRSPGNGCPKVPYAACGRCTKAKRKCEPVSSTLPP
jgi:hypothetical protein